MEVGVDLIYLTMNEACVQLSIKERTLRTWVQKVEKRTAFRFSRKINMSNPRYSYGKPVAQIMFDEDEMRLLGKMYTLRSEGANLSEVIDRLFLLSEDYEKKYPVDQRG